MNKIVRIIGSIVLSLALYAVPILLSCSVAYKWDSFIAFSLCIAAAIQILALIIAIYFKAEEQDHDT